jgi:transcriptional regulator with XRE-family HTH domain
MTNRIELILKTQNLTPTQFADAIGIQRSSLSHILARRNNPSLDFVTKLLNRFPEISSEWLLTGKGQMLKLGSSLPSDTSPQMSLETVLLDAKTPESEWDNPARQPKAEEPQSLPAQVAFQPQVAVPPPSAQMPAQALIEQEKIPPVTKRDASQNSDIERIIVFFTDGTFRSYS